MVFILIKSYWNSLFTFLKIISFQKAISFSSLILLTSFNLLASEKLSNASKQLSEEQLPKPLSQIIVKKKAAAAWGFLQAYTATYSAYSDGDKLGQAYRKLKRKNNQWKIELSSTIKQWLMTYKSSEYSKFFINHNQLFTQQFYSSSKLTFKSKRTVIQNYDWGKKLETGQYKKSQWELPIEGHLFDRMSHLLQLRADLLNNKQIFNYLISYKGKHKTYQYVKAGNEIISTEQGEFKSIRMNRVSNDNKMFSVWLSPELNYFPVKISQKKKGKPDMVLKLNKLTIEKNKTETKN